MSTKSKKSKNESSSEKKKIEWNPDDGLDWRDFLGIFILIGLFFWRLLRLFLAPVFWVYGENIRMVRFARASGHERTLTEDERWFVETVPALYTLTGLVGGLLVGTFAVLEFQEDIIQFFEDLNVDAIATVINSIGWVISQIFGGIIWFFTMIFNGMSYIVNFFITLFKINPFLALTGLLLLGVILTVIYISIMETGFFNGFRRIGKSFIYWLIGSPERFRLKVNSIYRRINHRLTVTLVGKERLHTRTQIYFKRVILYSFFLTLWSLLSGIFIGIEYDESISESDWVQILFIATVLLFAGVVSGTLFFGFVARLLDLYSRKKYIAPQFINDDVIDQEAINKFIEEDEKKIQEALRVPEEIGEDIERMSKKDKAKADSKE